MVLHTKIKHFVAAFAVALLALTNVPVARADDLPEYRLAITPTVQDLEELQPGETRTGTFSIKNTGKQDFNFTVGFAPYSVEGENYDPNYTKTTQYTEISEWISVDQPKGFLASGSETMLNYTVKVPADAHGGAQSAIITVTMDNKKSGDSTAVETVRQLGYLIFGNVDGEITKNGKILSNNVPGFVSNAPLTVSSIVENTGNVYTRAQYSVQVFPLFGDEELFTNEEDPEKSLIFPETKKYNAIAWEDCPSLGIFRVKQAITIFDQTDTVEKLVIVCPFWLLFVLILLVLLIIFWIISRIRSHKK